MPACHWGAPARVELPGDGVGISLVSSPSWSQVTWASPSVPQGCRCQGADGHRQSERVPCSQPTQASQAGAASRVGAAASFPLSPQPRCWQTVAAVAGLVPLAHTRPQVPLWNTSRRPSQRLPTSRRKSCSARENGGVMAQPCPRGVPLSPSLRTGWVALTRADGSRSAAPAASACQSWAVPERRLGAGTATGTQP